MRMKEILRAENLSIRENERPQNDVTRELQRDEYREKRRNSEDQIRDRVDDRRKEERKKERAGGEKVRMKEIIRAENRSLTVNKGHVTWLRDEQRKEEKREDEKRGRGGRGREKEGMG